MAAPANIAFGTKFRIDTFIGGQGHKIPAYSLNTIQVNLSKRGKAAAHIVHSV